MLIVPAHSGRELGWGTLAIERLLHQSRVLHQSRALRSHPTFYLVGEGKLWGFETKPRARDLEGSTEGLFQVPIVARRGPGIVGRKHLGKLSEGSQEACRVQPDAVEAQVGVVGGLARRSEPRPLFHQMSVHR